MPELTNMALPKPKKGDKATSQCVPCCGKEADGPKYPYGLEIRLGDDELKKLGLKIKDFDTDTIVLVQAKAETTSVRDEDTQHGGKSQSLTFQITDIAINREGEDGFKSGWDAATKAKGEDEAGDKRQGKGNGKP